MIRYLSASVRSSMLAVAVAAGSLMAAGAQAAEPGFGIGVSAGLQGVMVEPTYRFSDSFGVRGQVGRTSFSTSADVGEGDYDADLRLGGVGLMADYHPFGGNFRVSAGVMRSFAQLDIEGRDDLGTGVEGELVGRIAPNRTVAPAVSVGHGVTLGNVGINFELGAVFTDGYSVSLRERSGAIPQAVIDEEIRQIRDDLDRVPVLPFASLGLGMRF